MIKKIIRIAVIVVTICSFHQNIEASWGWESTNDPVPYYHQEWGKWYCYDDVKVFMVQIGDRTYKYLFNYDGEFINGWVTAMPIRLP